MNKLFYFFEGINEQVMYVDELSNKLNYTQTINFSVTNYTQFLVEASFEPRASRLKLYTKIMGNKLYLDLEGARCWETIHNLSSTFFISNLIHEQVKY